MDFDPSADIPDIDIDTSLLLWPKTSVQGPGHPCFVLGSLSFLTVTLQVGIHLQATQSQNSTAKLEQVGNKCSLLFTLPIDKQRTLEDSCETSR